MLGNQPVCMFTEAIHTPLVMALMRVGGTRGVGEREACPLRPTGKGSLAPLAVDLFQVDNAPIQLNELEHRVCERFLSHPV